MSVEIVENLVRVGAFDALGVRREELLVQVPLVHARVMGSRPGSAQRSPDAVGLPRWAVVARRGPEGGAGVEGGSGGRDEDATGRRPPGRPPEAPAPPAGPVRAIGQTALVIDDELAPMPFIPSWSDVDRVRAELEVLRPQRERPPTGRSARASSDVGARPLRRLQRCPDGTRVRLAGVLERAQMPWIRSGHRTLFLTLEDETGLAEVVVFNDVFLRYGKLLKETVYLLVEGELQNNDERGLAIVAQRISTSWRCSGTGDPQARNGRRAAGGGRATKRRAVPLRHTPRGASAVGADGARPPLPQPVAAGPPLAEGRPGRGARRSAGRRAPHAAGSDRVTTDNGRASPAPSRRATGSRTYACAAAPAAGCSDSEYGARRGRSLSYQKRFQATSRVRR